MENFWSLLKRGLKGTYISVEPFHLFRYIDEQVFRYNNRKKPMDDFARFQHVASHVIGKRLTYAEVTGKHSTTQAREAEDFLDFFRFFAPFSSSNLALISLCGTLNT